MDVAKVRLVVRTSLLVITLVFGLSDVQAEDAVTKLNAALADQTVTLQQADGRGYLDSVLEAFDIPADSQTLVFSKTSLQISRITTRTPRALYFNDEVYVGWVPGAESLEVTAIDPVEGSVFYTLDQSQDDPKFVRDAGVCLACHESHRTMNVPGLLLRSVYTDPDGHPNTQAGSYFTTDASPWNERYGGWYVTGTHGDLRHMGNVIRPEDVDDPRALDSEAGANLTDLSDRVVTHRYLEPGSDLIALLVLTHQSQAHNAISKLATETRAAEHHDAMMNRLLERADDYRSESTVRRVRKAATALVRILLFADEVPWTESVEGTSSFTERYSNRGPKDSAGRSLYELDLTSRLYRYRCSPMILTDAFDSLPETARTEVTRQLNEVLTKSEESFLTPEEQREISSLLSELKPSLRDTSGEN